GPQIAPIQAMRAGILALILFVVTVGMYAADPTNRHPYRRHWKHATIGKGALARVGAGAAVAQVRKRPRKWGGGAAGFGKRLGAGAATHAVGTTVEHAVAAPLHEDLHYHRSNKRAFAPRLRHALTSTVVTR